MSFHQDLENMTRDMHDKSLEVEYMQKTPVLSLIMERKNLKFKGGKLYYRELDTDTIEDIAQDYTVNEPLTHGTKDTTQRAYFERKTFQIPVQIDLDEELQNALGTEDGTQLHKLAEFKVRKTNEAGRLHIRKLLYAGPNSTVGLDSNKYMQGLNSGLQLDATNIATYGTLARSESQSSTNAWWQPADDRYTKTTQETEYSVSIDWLQSIVDPLTDLENSNGELVVIVGNTLWLALQSEAQARSMPVKVDSNGKFKFGIQEMIIGNMRIMKDPFLQTTYNSEMGETTGSAHALERRLYVLNTKDWEFLVHPKRNFEMTQFFDQKQIAGGADFKMARLLFAGNLICWHPNRSLYLANVAA